MGHALFRRTLDVHVRLDDDPRYAGSIHDDAVARAQGYPAALVPGAFVYGYVTRLAVEAFGPAWAAHGGVATRFRRPVFNGDRLRIAAGALVPEGDMLRSAVVAANQDGVVVAEGWVAIPAAEPPVPPPLDTLPVRPRPETPQAVAPGELSPGMPLTSDDRVLTEAAFHASLSAFGETSPIYRRDGFVHSGCLMRLAMGDAYSAFRFPSPVILTEVEAQHYAVVQPGQRVKTSGRVAEVFERNGRHYFVTEEHLIADDSTVAARFRRTTIYG